MNLWIARHDYCSSYQTRPAGLSLNAVGASCFIAEAPCLSVTKSHHEEVVTPRTLTDRIVDLSSKLKL